MKVTYIDHMGSDLRVVNAARVSFDKVSTWEKVSDNDPVEAAIVNVLSEKDAKLIRYLAKHKHWTPFGHCQATFRIKAPIFVARQLGKHQVGMVWNEVSRRYVDNEPEFYRPDFWRARADNAKQGSSDWEVTFFDCPATTSESEAILAYKALLDADVCPEQARMVLPQSMYTEWYWTGSLAAWARVCHLRLDRHTQKETQDVAKMLDKEMEKLYPISWKALMEVADED
jgi:thymidylate synthase (FAD)